MGFSRYDTFSHPTLSTIEYSLWYLLFREKWHHCQTAKTGSALCVISVVRLLKNATEGIDLDTSSLLLPRYKMVGLERWSGLGGGGCAWRSPEEVFEEGYFFWALLCIKRDSISGIQDFFDGQIINTKWLRNLGQWQQLEGSVNTHRKKQCLVSESITQKLEARREGLERLYCDWSGENR